MASGFLKGALRVGRRCMGSMGTTVSVTSLLEAKDQILLAKDKLLEEKEEHKESMKLSMKLQNQLLEAQQEKIARLYVQLLEAKGKNTLRGLIEYMEEEFCKLHQVYAPSQLRRWEQVLKCERNLSACIETQAHWKTVHNQAQGLVGIYDVLSQHVHQGQYTVAALKAENKKLVLIRGQLSTQQCKALLCTGQCLGLPLDLMEVTEAATTGEEIM